MLILSRSGKNCFVGRLFTCSASSAVVIAVLLLFCHTIIIVYGRDTLGHYQYFNFTLLEVSFLFSFLHLIIPEQSNESRNSLRSKYLARFQKRVIRFFHLGFYRVKCVLSIIFTFPVCPPKKETLNYATLT